MRFHLVLEFTMKIEVLRLKLMNSGPRSADRGLFVLKVWDRFEHNSSLLRFEIAESECENLSLIFFIIYNRLKWLSLLLSNEPSLTSKQLVAKTLVPGLIQPICLKSQNKRNFPSVLVVRNLS